MTGQEKPGQKGLEKKAYTDPESWERPKGGILGMSYNDHIKIGSTVPDEFRKIMEDHPDTPLIDLIDDKRLEKFFEEMRRELGFLVGKLKKRGELEKKPFIEEMLDQKIREFREALELAGKRVPEEFEKFNPSQFVENLLKREQS
jgi:hypothetical protein